MDIAYIIQRYRNQFSQLKVSPVIYFPNNNDELSELINSRTLPGPFVH